METCSELNKKAHSALQQGKLHEALATYDNLISVCPESHSGYVGRLTVLYKLNKWDECLGASEICLQKFPELHAAVLYKGNSLTQQGRFAEAREFSHSFLRDDPKMLAPNLVLAMLYNRQRHFKQCLDLCSNTLEAHPDNLSLLNFKANALLQLSRLNESRDTYASLSRLDPASLLPTVGEANITFKMGLWKECIAACSTILNIDSENFHIINLKVESLIALGEFEEAENILDASIAFLWKMTPGYITINTIRQSTPAHRRFLMSYCRAKGKAERGTRQKVAHIIMLLATYPQRVSVLPRIYGSFSDGIDTFDNTILGVPL